MKISFKNDYSEGAHPAILEALLQTNLVQQAGYGLDTYSEQAKQLIRERINAPKAEVFFISGGTQANMLVLGYVLRPYESIIACETAHITDNEAGAIEAVGHKIHLAPSVNGKLTVEAVRNYATRYTNFPHQVQPRLVYITQSTEVGSIYSLKELKALYACCQELGLLLYMDGARLAQGLNNEQNDIQWEDLARYTDIFYIGATKNGGLLGEAIVFCRPKLAENFSCYIKQKGALLSKGRLLGLQFLTLFQNNLYNELGWHANAQMKRIKEAFLEKNIPFLSDTCTNQLFPILTNAQITFLAKDFDFYQWQKIDETHTAIRLITSWATTNEQIETLLSAIKKI
ncbi:MAG: aminotransferase class V-fold PLP-dependent enzyme [Capnocytophaga sp.]|nr:aminotransferase class V-fold PLP-dependent enzyme [Capnocytophaga sp.]